MVRARASAHALHTPKVLKMVKMSTATSRRARGTTTACICGTCAAWCAWLRHSSRWRSHRYMPRHVRLPASGSQRTAARCPDGAARARDWRRHLGDCYCCWGDWRYDALVGARRQRVAARAYRSVGLRGAAWTLGNSTVALSPTVGFCDATSLHRITFRFCHLGKNLMQQTRAATVPNSMAKTTQQETTSTSCQGTSCPTQPVGGANVMVRDAVRQTAIVPCATAVGEASARWQALRRGWRPDTRAWL